MALVKLNLALWNCVRTFGPLYITITKHSRPKSSYFEQVLNNSPLHTEDTVKIRTNDKINGPKSDLTVPFLLWWPKRGSLIRCGKCKNSVDGSTCSQGLSVIIYNAKMTLYYPPYPPFNPHLSTLARLS